MNPKASHSVSRTQTIRSLVAILCAALLVPGDTLAYSMQASSAPAQQPANAQQAPKIPADQLDALVAPIALYPDPLLAQTLAASTYPLEIIQLQQWLAKNKNLKDKALVDAVSKQPWDPSVQAMAALPDVVKRLADDIQWTTDLGNAFLAQQSDVMDAVQRMRKKAQDKGNLKSNEQQKVETKVVENKTVIVVEQANPEVVYVPSYSPTVVYGPPVYPYPPIYYPTYPVGAMAVSFGVGLAMGAAWGGGWGWGCGWGGNNDITINNNNNFNRNSNISGGNRTNVGSGNRGQGGRGQGGRGQAGGNKWNHNPQHRGGAPYGDRGTANKFGGTARGDSLANRQSSARQQVGRQGGNMASTRQGGSRAGGSAGSMDRGGAGNRGGSSGFDRGGGGGRGGADSIGSRDMSRGGGGSRGGSSGFGGGSGGFSGSSARSASSRGSSSMGSRGGGGRSGGGGRRR